MRSDEACGSRSLVGYPFTETDMIGGSLSETPRKDVLIRWAGAAALSPMTIGLYRAAIDRHEWLAPYTWSQVQSAGRTGEPITKPLFFDFPGDQAAYPISGQWLPLGPVPTFVCLGAGRQTAQGMQALLPGNPRVTGPALPRLTRRPYRLSPSA